MSLDIASVIAGGVGLWLLQWICKHILDRLLLPKFQDWFARLNRKWALVRAEQVVRQYQHDVSQQQGVLWKLRDEIADLYLIVILVGAVNILWPIVTTLQDSAYNAAPLFSRLTLAYMYAALFLVLIVFARAKMKIAKRDVKARDADAHRVETEARLRKLLASAHIDDPDIQGWFSRLSPSQGPRA